MSIQSVNNNSDLIFYQKQQKVNNDEVNLNELDPVDVFEKSDPLPDAKTYSKDNVLNSALDESERKIAAFQQLLSKFFDTQADLSAKSAGKLRDIVARRVKSATPEEIAAAQEQIADGGYYSVDAVAGRIMDMAKALSGGDTSKSELLRNAVIKGFSEAEKAWGGKLPEICQKTYDAVMKAFDEWDNK